MKEIFEFNDYRDFLRSHYEETKGINPHYSYRYISMKIGFKSAFLSRLFKKETHLALNKTSAFAELMKLSTKECQYFDELVRLGRAKSDEEREISLCRLNRIRGISFSTIQSDEEEFFSKCHHMTVRSLLGIFKFTENDFRKIGQMIIPAVSKAEIGESVKLLERLGMITKDEFGFFTVTDNYISTKEKWAAKAIHEYQLKNIELSKEALENLKKEERDISTVTFTINSSRLPELREKLNTFREDMLRFSEECIDDDRVMHLNLQLFPTADIKKVIKKPSDRNAGLH